MLSQEAIEKMLGIKAGTRVTAEDMAKGLKMTFFPFRAEKISPEVLHFRSRLERTLTTLGVTIIPFTESLELVPLTKIIKRGSKIILNNTICGINSAFGVKANRSSIPSAVFRNLLKRHRVKRGISVIAVGENDSWNLPMDHTSSFTESSVITIVDMPKDITHETDFLTHFNTAMTLFAHHMTNIIIGVGSKNWILYNFNASHPIYDLEKDFDNHVLHGLLPKIAAPIKPLKFTEFELLNTHFDISDVVHKPVINDLMRGSQMFEGTGLYPPGKKIDDLPFRNDFYRWIGKIHLDERNGMSFGFMARQMPTKLSALIRFSDADDSFKSHLQSTKDHFTVGGEMYIKIEVLDGKYIMKVPDIWVMTQRSGCNKVNFNPNLDLVKIGLVNGKMYIETPTELKLRPDYKTSFDTQVILAHTLGNSIIASILQHFSPGNEFAHSIESTGVAIAHWHGYINPKHIFTGWHVHGVSNPHVACSSPQSAIYALTGKLRVFKQIHAKGEIYSGDIHIEPHHGTNITFPTLQGLSEFLLANREISVLGNKYLTLYNL